MAALRPAGRSSGSKVSPLSPYLQALRQRSGTECAMAMAARAWSARSRLTCPSASTSLRVRLTKRCYCVSPRLSKQQPGTEGPRRTSDQCPVNLSRSFRDWDQGLGFPGRLVQLWLFNSAHPAPAAASPLGKRCVDPKWRALRCSFSRYIVVLTGQARSSDGIVENSECQTRPAGVVTPASHAWVGPNGTQRPSACSFQHGRRGGRRQG